MKLILLLVACTVFQMAARGQGQTGKIDGTVTDSASNTNLDLATISIFSKDSTLINYQLTDKDGRFAIVKLPLNQELRFNVTYVGYNGYDQFFRLDEAKPSASFKVKLTVNMSDTNTVVVTAVIPIRMNGDTLEINPAAFKMDKNAVVEELLNQVPGITIWADGSITVNGKPIPKVLVDGKPFLNDGDPRVATQNLPKSAIDKIQVFQEVDRTKEIQDDKPRDSVLTMNIKLKEGNKNGYFGKGGVGYGTGKRYEADLSFQVFNEKNSLALGGGVNNINKNIGGLQQMLKNNTYRNNNPNLYNVSNFNRSGINETYSLGTAYTHNFILSPNGRNTDRFNGGYNYSGNNSYNERNSLQQRTTKNNPQLIESVAATNGTSQLHSVELRYDKSQSYNKSMNIFANSNFNTSQNDSRQFSSVRDTNNVLLNTNQSRTIATSNNNTQALNFNLNNYSQDNVLKRFYVYLRVNVGNTNRDSRVTSSFNSFTNPAQDTSYDRLYKNNSSDFSASFNINYMGLKRLLLRRYNLFGIDMTLLQNLTYTKRTDDALVSDFDSSGKVFITNNKLTNFNKLQSLASNPGIALQKNFYKYAAGFNSNSSFSLQLMQNLKKEANTSSIAYRNVTRNFSFFSPSLNYNQNYNKDNVLNYNIHLNLNRAYSYPTIDQLYMIVDSINLYSIRIGNPDLKNTANNSASLNFNFNKQKPNAKFDFNTSANANYNYSTSPVTDSVINEASGKRVVYLINAGDGSNLNISYNANLIRKFKKNSLQLQYRGSQGNNRTTHFIDGLSSNTVNKTISNDVNLQYSLRSLLIVKLSEVVSNYSSSQSNAALSSYKTRNISTQLGITLNYPKHATIATTLSITDNSSVPDKIVLWHAYGTYRFMKSQQGELKLSAFDLLRRFQNISNYSGVDGTTTTISNGLSQYFMVTFSYYPRKFGKGANNRKGAKRSNGGDDG